MSWIDYLVIYLAFTILFGNIIKAIILVEYDFPEFIQYIFTVYKKAKESEKATKLGLIVAFIVDIFFLPATVFLLLILGLVSLGGLLFIKTERKQTNENN